MSGKTMFFEVSSSGHRLDYIHRILKALGTTNAKTTREVVFVLGPDFAPRLETQLLTRAKQANNVTVQYMTETEFRRCSSTSGILRRLATWRTLNHYLKATGSDLGFVLYLDPVLPALAVPWSRAQAQISGILFRPTVHYRALGVDESTGGARLKEDLTARLEPMVLARALKCHQLREVLSLDPFFPEHARARYGHGNKVRWLPEPYGSLPDFAASGAEDTDRITFLLFGIIGPRKGAIEVLEALMLLSEEEARKVRLRIVGRIQASVRPQMEDLMHRIRNERPLMEVSITDDYVPNETLHQILTEADVLVAAYRRHVGSSGVLALASAYRTPVISQRYGLMGALVTRYGLGLVCDPSDPNELVNAIRTALSEDLETLMEPDKMEEFALANSAEAFVRGVLSGGSITFER